MQALANFFTNKITQQGPHVTLLVSHLTTILKQISSSTLAEIRDQTWPLDAL
jgi:hypothetical protein